MRVRTAGPEPGSERSAAMKLLTSESDSRLRRDRGDLNRMRTSNIINCSCFRFSLLLLSHNTHDLHTQRENEGKTGVCASLLTLLSPCFLSHAA